MKIKFDVLVSKQMEIDVPAHWLPFAEAWLTNEDERTDEQWDLLEHHNWGEMIEEFLPEDEEEYETEVCTMLESENEEDEDPFNKNDPYVVTDPMAFY